MLICLLLILKISDNFSSSSHVPFLPPRPLLSSIHPPLLSSLFFLSLICLPLHLSADCNRTHRLRPDGDDGQAVPTQAHHRWHQCLCPPHWLRPRQEGARRTLSVFKTHPAFTPSVSLFVHVFPSTFASLATSFLYFSPCSRKGSFGFLFKTQSTFSTELSHTPASRTDGSDQARITFSNIFTNFCPTAEATYWAYTFKRQHFQT